MCGILTRCCREPTRTTGNLACSDIYICWEVSGRTASSTLVLMATHKSKVVVKNWCSIVQYLACVNLDGGSCGWYISLEWLRNNCTVSLVCNFIIVCLVMLRQRNDQKKISLSLSFGRSAVRLLIYIHIITKYYHKSMLRVRYAVCWDLEIWSLYWYWWAGRLEVRPLLSIRQNIPCLNHVSWSKYCLEGLTVSQGEIMKVIHMKGLHSYRQTQPKN